MATELNTFLFGCNSRPSKSGLCAKEILTLCMRRRTQEHDTNVSKLTPAPYCDQLQSTMTDKKRVANYMGAK
eukprot:4884941-Amphidinium_carterae.1